MQKRIRIGAVLGALLVVSTVFAQRPKDISPRNVPVDFAAREKTAPPPIAAKLAHLRQQKVTKGWTFEPVYTHALDFDLKTITGAVVPPNFRQHVKTQNALAAAALKKILTSPIPPPPQVGTNACFTNLGSFDWRKYNGTTPVRDQGQCGSCWVFGAHGAMEGNWHADNAVSIDSSEQDTLDCNAAEKGCGGGWPSDALTYLMQNGSATESAYRYMASRGTCKGRQLASPYGIRAWGYVGNDDGVPSVNAIKSALCHYGPLAVGVNATDAFQAYGTDHVFNEHDGGDINHVVTLIGWDEAKRAWLIKNSWGTGWGITGGSGTERGYMWIAYDSNKIGYGAAWALANQTPGTRPANPLAVSGTVHLQDFGDTPLRDATWAGTVGQSRRLEGLLVNFSSPVAGLGIEYMCHEQDKGDSAWMPGGSFCGSRGQSKRLEGLAMRLTGPNANKYDIFYACHLQDLGDEGPVKNGAFCGTRGQSRRLEAMEVWVMPKPAEPDHSLTGLVHLQDLGDMPFREGVWAGTKGQSRRLEGFAFNFNSPIAGLGIEYMCHVQDSGDTAWMSGGSFCGTRGQSKRIEGIALRLTGPNANQYNVSYSCHLQDLGDRGPVMNGAFCGTRGQSRRLEAMLVNVTKR